MVALTVQEYTAALLSATSPSQLNGQSFELDNSNNDWDGSQADGDVTFAYADHPNGILTVVHANYIGPKVSTSVGSLAMGPASMDTWDAEFARQRYAQGLGPLSFSSYTLIIIGIALIAAATLIAIFAPEAAPAWVFLFRVALTIGALALTAGIAYAVLTPTVESQTCNAAGDSCCSLLVGIGGANNVCTTCSTVGCNTSVTPAGGIGGFLVQVALGVGAIAAVGIGGYAAYRYVTNRPRPGFGNAPPFAQRHPTLAAAPATIYRDVRAGARRLVQ